MAHAHLPTTLAAHLPTALVTPAVCDRKHSISSNRDIDCRVTPAVCGRRRTAAAAADLSAAAQSYGELGTKVGPHWYGGCSSGYTCGRCALVGVGVGVGARARVFARGGVLVSTRVVRGAKL